MKKTVVGNCTLYLGDSLEIVKSFQDKSFSAIITDPPYGLNIKYNLYEDTLDNYKKIVAMLTEQSKRIANVAAIFSCITNLYLFSNPDWIMSWVRPAGTNRGHYGFNCWTPIVVYGTDPYASTYHNGCTKSDTFIDKSGIRDDTIHPVSKPVSVMTWLVNRFTLNEGDSVLDPFMGSGSTAIACIRARRNFTGIEIDPLYYEEAIKRIKKEQIQEHLL
jgi:DNA modification methylase